MKTVQSENGAALIFAFILLSLSVIIATTLITENLSTQTSFENIQAESLSVIYADTAASIAVKQFEADNNYTGTPDNLNNTWLPIGTEGGSILIKKINEVSKGKKKTVTYLCQGKDPSTQATSIQIVVEN